MSAVFSADDLSFRDDVLAFLKDVVPASLKARLVGGRKLERAELAAWHAVLDERGWCAPHWPVEWGGTDWSPVRHYLFRECLHLAPAPEPHVQNINLIGPVIAAFGSEAMKRRFLAPIRTLDMCFCQGFSEPGTGSDLASLKTRATRDGGHFVIEGQKTWTTSAHMADWMFCLARTQVDPPRHAGLSMLLVPMDSPGVTVRPIHSSDGQHHLNEVFLDAVRVPAEYLVGEENNGWDYARFLLAQERMTISRVGVSRRNLSLARSALPRLDRTGTGLAGYERRLALLEVQLKALEMLNLRALEEESRDASHRTLGPQVPSMLKLRGAELLQASSQLLMDLAGPEAWHPHAGGGQPLLLDAALGDAATHYLHLRAASIYGGASEIQRNLIARSVLGH